ncbi:hypothetical protein QOZ80_5BG0409290 [Eleusine coracana subsp. coracana]|nr:hypothetical protein QOZ80_5BG0409290 [Eleusine coracana subsp. coracana]
MDRAFCTDAAGHRFTRTSNSSFTLRFDKRNDSMNITTGIPEKLLRMQGVTRLVQATNDANELRIYLSFAQPVLNSSDEILSVLKATHDAVLTPTSRSTLGNRRFGYVVNKVSDTAIVTVSCDTSSIISRQGTPVDSASAEPFTFLYDTQRPAVKLGTSTRRTSSHNIRVLIKFAKPVFNFSSSAVQLSGGNLLSFHEASKSIYALQIQAVDKLVSVQVPENAAQDVAGNPNLASGHLQVRHYSVPASSSSIATVTTIVFVATAVVATLLTVSTSSLVASGAISRPSSHMISEPSRNLVRMACHIQMFALSRWMSVNLPIEYYEFAKGIEWSIPYMPLPWEGPAADPFMGYSTMPVVAYSELVDRSAVGAADISYPRAQQSQPAAMPTEIPGDDGGMKPIMMPPMQTIPLDGKPLSAMEYRSFFENPDMKPEADIIMKKLQDLDVWKQFGRNMLWLGVIGGGLILAHAVTLAYLKLRYKRGGRAEQHEETRKGYGALVFPRLEMMVVILAMPCISQAAATMISRGMDRGVACVGIVLLGILACLLLGLVLFLWLGIIIGMVQQVQYEEDELEEEEESTRRYQWCQEVILGPAFRRGHWTSCTGLSNKLGPLFEDLRGPPAPPNQDNKERTMDKLLGVVRIHYTFFECLKRIIVAATIATAASWVPASMASLQLLFLVVTKPFIKKRVQLVEMVSLASEVFVFACCQLMMIHHGLLAMLGVFLLSFAAQMCNQWNALFRQMRLLGGAKTAFAGLLLLFLPSSSSLLVSLFCRTPPPPPPPTDRRRHGFHGEERQQVHHRHNNNERSWLWQLREMAKASFTNDYIS